MRTIGIIANPASGKDIRRLVSHATVIDNHEKINIIERIILGAQALGVERILIMPDTHGMGLKVIDRLSTSSELTCAVEMIDMPFTASPQDTVTAAEQLAQMKVGCAVVLGGDGTHRLAAKGLGDVPLIGVSTGTNNVYPQLREGTVVGMAAAAVASGLLETDAITRRDKRLEITLVDGKQDIALIDAVITTERYVGAKAIWDPASIHSIYVTRAHPGSIGFSAIVGTNCTIDPDEARGGLMTLGGPLRFMAPIAAGVVIPLRAQPVRFFEPGEVLLFQATTQGMIALDGERELSFHRGDEIQITLTRRGPRWVRIDRTLTLASRAGFFHRGTS